MVSNLERMWIDLMLKIPVVGKPVTLSFDNSRSPTKTGPFASITKDTYEVSGIVSIKPSWDRDPNNFCVVVPDSPVRVRIVDIHSVLAVDGVPVFKRGEKVVRPEKHTFKIDGSKGKQYTVVFDGHFWSCTCPGFNFRKTCRHITEARETV